MMSSTAGATTARFEREWSRCFPALWASGSRCLCQALV